MKALLIRPPSSLGELTEISHLHHPLNIAYIASFLLREGIEAEIFDCEIEGFDRAMILDAVRKYRPDVVGFSCFTASIQAGNMLAGWIKEHSKDILTVAGGPHVDALPVRTLEEMANFDLTVKGDGEITFRNICEELVKEQRWDRIPGVFWRGNDGIVVNKPSEFTSDLDALPFPARHLLKLDKYTGGVTPGVSSDFRKATEMIISRGCPYKCTHCAVRATFGDSVRFRSAGNVVAEIQECKERLGFNHIYFVDSTFTLNMRLVHELCDALEKMDISWNCMTRPERVPDDLLEHIARAGCIKIGYGVEAGSPRVRKLINRELDQDVFVSAFERTRKHGMMTAAFFIIGSHPSETAEEIEMTSRLAHDLNADFTAFSVLTPYPGTATYELMKSEGLIGEENWENFAHHNPSPTWHTYHFSGQELADFQRKLIRRHYFNPRYVISRLLKIRSLGELRYYAKAGLALLRHLYTKRTRKESTGI